jgi:DNA-binding Xre family transcriptional regulator
LGKVRVTPVFKVSQGIRKKIEIGLKNALETYEDASVLLAKIKKKIPWVDTPRGSLVAYMTGQSWTQKKLAKATGISQADISKMVNGKRVIGLATAKKLGMVLGVDYRKFL